MVIKIEQGLFTPEFMDHHAVLGVPVDAEPKEIRKQYLKLARRLHPDSCATESENDRARAAEYLSKLVNPAYEKLSDEKNYAEYQLLLKLKGKQISQQQNTVVLSSESARKLAGERGLGVDTAYHTAIKDLANQQYSQLEEVATITGQISELNMVYLMRKAVEGSDAMSTPIIAQGRAAMAGGTPADGRSVAKNKPQPAPTTPQQKAARDRRSVVSSYLWRAQELERQQDYSGAIKELRDALKLEPQNADIHGRIGVIYLKTNQGTMAKIHFRKAVEIDPNDQRAQQGLKRVDPAVGGSSQKAATAKPGAKPANRSGSQAGKSGSSKGGKSEGGGLFGLFGGKKK
jgi:curved DNA-binding protein CbpA